MRSTRTLWVAVAAAAAAVAIVGSTFAQTPPGGGMHRSVLGRAAIELGVPEERLAGALDRAHSEMMAEAVASGHLTQAQADAMGQHHRAMTQHGTGMLPGLRGHPTMGGMMALGASAHGMMGQGMPGAGVTGGAGHGGDAAGMGQRHGTGGAPPVP